MIILPHGGWPLIPATLATMAWMTSLTLDGCDYVRLTGPAVETLTQSNIYPYVDIGFHSYRVPSFYSAYESWEMRLSDPCLAYDLDIAAQSSSSSSGLLEKGDSNSNEKQDSNQGNEYMRTSQNMMDPTIGFFWSIGRMSHKVATVVGGSAALFMWVPCLCLSFTERTWRIGGLQLLIAAFFQLGSMVWFFNMLCMERGSKCHWYFGSYSSLASFVLYISSSICIFLKYPRPVIVKLVRDRIEEEFQRYQRRNGQHSMPTRSFSASTYATEMTDNESSAASQPLWNKA